jgi:hypothetical protein
MGGGKMYVKCWLESLKGRDHLGDLDVDAKGEILKWILWRQTVRIWTALTFRRI